MFLACQSSDNTSNDLVEANLISVGATCTGSSSCKACKNCKYCKHCSKEGGSCGVCR